MDRQLNFVDGTWTRSRGGVFRPDIAPDREVWPRSDRADLEDALLAAQEATAVWGRRDGEERRELLVRFAGALGRELGTWSEVAPLLGLDPWDWSQLAPIRVPEVEPAPGAADSRGGVLVLAPHWSELVGGSAERLIAGLAAGGSVVLLCDPRLPHLGHGLARAWCAAEGSADHPGLVQVLHGADAGLLRECSSIAWVTLEGARTEAELESVGDADETRGFRRVRNRAAWVRMGADPGEEARDVARRAFGRLPALGGQASEQIGRVYCAPQIFSLFTEALLAELDGLYTGDPPLPLIDHEALADLRSAQFLGLDQGATQIFGHPGNASENERAPLPLVFTNVEADARLLRRRRPAPVLALVRWVPGMAGPDAARR